MNEEVNAISTSASTIATPTNTMQSPKKRKRSNSSFTDKDQTLQLFQNDQKAQTDLRLAIEESKLEIEWKKHNDLMVLVSRKMDIMALEAKERSQAIC